MLFSKKTKSQPIKPMRTKRARVFSLIGLASFALLFFHVGGNQELGSLGVIGMTVSIIGLAYTGVFRAFMSPEDEFERQIAHKAVFRAYGLIVLGMLAFMTAAGLVAHLAEISATKEQKIGPGYIGDGLFNFYSSYEKPQDFWNDTFWIFAMMSVFMPVAIMAWLIPTEEIDPDGF